MLLSGPATAFSAPVIGADWPCDPVLAMKTQQKSLGRANGDIIS